MDNPELGHLVIKQCETFPETFDMSAWAQPAPCGTAACLAGHALLLSGYTVQWDAWEGSKFFRPDGIRVTDPGNEAQQILGMSQHERFGNGDIFAASQGTARALRLFREMTERGE